jgi:hypothetical protein
MSIPNWIIDKQRREQENESRQQLHAPPPEPPIREEKPEIKKEKRGSTEINFTL